MSFNDREERILNILREKNSIRCSELAKLLYVSVSTLRRDLEKLEEKNFIIREHGICKLSSKLRDEKYSYNLREQQNGVAKNRIAKKAVKFIKECMEARPFADFDLPLVAEASAGLTFGTMEELEA